MRWEPTAQEAQEKLIEMAYAWGDIEERAIEDIEFETNDRAGEPSLGDAVRAAFRVEAQHTENDFFDACSPYVLFYDVADVAARAAARRIERSAQLSKYINEIARPWHTRDNLIVRVVPRSTPVEGQICRRVGEEHPAEVMPSLGDVPTFRPAAGTTELVERWPYFLTPIEAPFYDALAETGLTFSVQPWIQTADQKYRTDFVVFYGGGMVAVELDGHDSHKTKEQRGKDAEKDRALQKRGFRTVRFTGSQVFADVDGCIRELQDVLRQSESSP